MAQITNFEALKKRVISEVALGEDAQTMIITLQGGDYFYLETTSGRLIVDGGYDPERDAESSSPDFTRAELTRLGLLPRKLRVSRLPRPGQSTRGLIARLAPSANWSFHGRIHAYDGYPTGLGKQLWQLYHEEFKGDLRRMLQVLIDDHPAGWSTLINADFSKAPCHIKLADLTAEEKKELEHTPICYCHGDDVGDEELTLTRLNARQFGIEWVYAFTANAAGLDSMIILDTFRWIDREKDWHGQTFSPPVNAALGAPDPHAEWRVVKHVPLDGPEPEWDTLVPTEAYRNLERRPGAST